ECPRRRVARGKRSDARLVDQIVVAERRLRSGRSRPRLGGPWRRLGRGPVALARSFGFVLHMASATRMQAATSNRAERNGPSAPPSAMPSVRIVHELQGLAGLLQRSRTRAERRRPEATRAPAAEPTAARPESGRV